MLLHIPSPGPLKGHATVLPRLVCPDPSLWELVLLFMSRAPSSLFGVFNLCLPLFQHTSHGEGRQEVSSRTSRSGARCRNSIASCADEQPHIGNYRLLKTIGKGNFAKVKLARHILTGREVIQCANIANAFNPPLLYQLFCWKSLSQSCCRLLKVSL